MYVLLNGAFGIGKTSVAMELRKLLPGVTIFDPEWVGLVLMRVPGYAKSDFQHLASWRRLSVLGARAFGAVSQTVIVPMAFSELSYLDEVRSGLGRFGRPVLHFCLTAPLEVVQQRLAARGEPADDPTWGWVHRRAKECCKAHAGTSFATHIPADEARAEELATEIAHLVQAAV